MNQKIKKLNSNQVDELLNTANIENNRIDEHDFDGGNFNGNFDNVLLELGYIRLAVERKDDERMILVEKNELDKIIAKNYSYKKLLHCEKMYHKEDEYSFNDYIEAYTPFWILITNELGLVSKSTSAYVDGLDYILNICEKLGYVFGAAK